MIVEISGVFSLSLIWVFSVVMFDELFLMLNVIVFMDKVLFVLFEVGCLVLLFMLCCFQVNPYSAKSIILFVPSLVMFFFLLGSCVLKFFNDFS